MSSDQVLAAVLAADDPESALLRSQLAASVLAIPLDPGDNEFDIHRGRLAGAAFRTARELACKHPELAGRARELLRFGERWAHSVAAIDGEVTAALASDSCSARAMRSLAVRSFTATPQGRDRLRYTTAQFRALHRPVVCQLARRVAGQCRVDAGVLLNATFRWAEMAVQAPALARTM